MKRRRNSLENKALHFLREYGQWHRRYADYTGFASENVVERVINNPGRSEKREHHPLCPETPRHLQRVEQALDCLPKSLRDAVDITHCCPLKEDGTAYSDGDLASLLKISLKSFRSMRSKGKNLYLVHFREISRT